jgi:phosphoglycerate dehydrogenase-like enzyme
MKKEDSLPLTIFISTPLESEHVEKIRSVAPDRVRVIYEPDLFPPTRYVADHHGKAGHVRTPEQERRWRENIAKADIFWDFPPKGPDGSGGIDLAQNVKWVQTTSSGVGQLVANLGLQERDLIVTTASGVHAGPLSEFFMLGVLMHFKRLSHLKREQSAHHWERYCGDDLSGKVMAIVGAGSVGRHIAKVARCFGIRVAALDVELEPDRAQELGFERIFPITGLHQMLADADIVVLSVPHTPDTERMIDARAFGAMKEGAVFINIARGQVVDEPALIDALRSGRIGFAVLDVFAVEPLPKESPLWDMPNVLVSPHSASTVASENEKITDIFCHNLRCYLDGAIDKMKNILNKSKMY